MPDTTEDTIEEKDEIRHFIDLDQLDTDTLRGILNTAHEYKIGNKDYQPLHGEILAMIFDKPSMRTRVSFEVGMQQLGGKAIMLPENEIQFGRRETVADTARVLSRYVDAIMVRTDDPAKLQELVEYATVPVINGLTDATHPCQLMADVMTFEEHKGDITGKTVAWVGDGNNVATSWIHAAARFHFTLRIATPDNRRVDPAVIAWAREQGADVIETDDPITAVKNADAVVADTWISMGDEETNVHNLFMPYQVNETLMAEADAKAIFMHCLPAHREEEVTTGVIDGPQSVVFDEAENRLHAQKGVLAWSLIG
jgi:ornithine carbamoyltransferase